MNIGLCQQPQDLHLFCLKYQQRIRLKKTEKVAEFFIMAFFSLLMLDPTWIGCWEKMVGFQKVKSFIHSVEVVNDCAERGVTFITDFKDVTKDVQQNNIFSR